MGEAFAHFSGIVDPVYFAIVALGVFGGILVGSLPGLTPTMGVALLVPFTFHLSAELGLLMLGSVYVGSVYGGAITAILINIPGAPASIATMLDGHPMANKGEGEKAIHLATIASFVGGIFGVLLLMFFAPFLAQVSLNFGPAEHFWIAVFGITVIAGLSQGSIWKGLIGGAIGLWVSTIGISEITGTSRFTFGFSQLTGGIGLVSALIGLFAFPQAMTFLERTLLNKEKRNNKDNVFKKSRSFLSAINETLGSIKILGLGTFIGSLVGLIPGAGGQVAGLVAYNEARRQSSEKEKFGTGHKDGIIVTESANNAMVGCSLVPLLTLGIPGSPTAAVLLGGLLMNGLWPGPELFQENASVTYTFIFGMMLAQVCMLFIGGFGARFFKKAMYVPPNIMAPLILVLCVIGSFAARNNFGDVWSMLIIGIAMFFGLKLGFSPAPVALGFILGEYAERGFLLASRASVSEGSVILHFLDRPIVIALIILTAISIITTTIFEVKHKQNGEGVNK
ncbi:tripartite tricarboxylate transporter permease [Natranaerobius trueperi]|uniref:C4-dicarboxylate ABC transporter permease n=1 Tax=Natranaerobius trueperi TaxID=759412 RepID=A0A226BXU8_9FIRM|nr:tripartite tricarboxylate transporter permease [Natranaerobius trueperi]OWZ83751.1 C4-dicarboxylate ABC transporter permease [Natranaerobius trueperi]